MFDMLSRRKQRRFLNIRTKTEKHVKNLEIRKRRCVKGKEVFDEGFDVDYIEAKFHAST